MRIIKVIVLALLISILAVAQESKLLNHIQYFSSLPDRLAGTESCKRAADYIVDTFRSYGLKNIQIEKFDVVVPIQEYAYLSTKNKNIPLHAIWPNSIRTCTTPPEGITGTIVYCDKNGLKSLSGKNIDGIIVLMDFNTDNLWLDVASLGAKAIIFIEPDSASRTEFEKKFLSVPLNVPRFLIKKEYLSEIIKLTGVASQVTVNARVTWTRLPAYNIFATIEGTDPELKKEIIILESFYDSISAVPSIAPGAESSCGISALLDLASYFTSNPPRRTLVLLATSAHFESLKGISCFVSKHLRTAAQFKNQLGSPINAKFVFCLDLTSQSDQVGLWHNTYNFNYQRFLAPFAKRLIEAGKEECRKFGYNPEQSIVNGVSPEKGVSWSNFLPERIRTNGEIVTMAGFPSISFVTVNDSRKYIDTPFDVLKNIRIENLQKQVNLIRKMVSYALNDKEFFSVSEINIKDKFATLTAKVVRFDPRKSFVPNEPIKDALVLPRWQSTMEGAVGYSKSFYGVRGDALEITDENGEATIIGFSLGTNFLLQAYSIDKNSGEIYMAPDYGVNGDEQYPNRVSLDTLSKKWLVVLFYCKPINLIGLIDPQYLTAINKLDIFDLSNSLPETYSYFLETYDVPPLKWSSYIEPAGVVFAKKGTYVKIAGRSGPLGIRLLLLNSEPTTENKAKAEGLGFPVDTTDSIKYLPYQAAKDMIILDSYRVANFKRYNIRNERLDALQSQSKELLNKAEKAQQGLDWESFLSYSRQSQAIESRAYPDVKSTANDVIKGIIFYFLLLLPFAYFGERLFFGFPKLEKRIAGMALIFLIIYFIMRFVHPAFKLTSAPEVILLAFIVLSLSIVVISIITSKFEEQMQRLKREGARVYQTDVGRIAAAGTAFSLGVANMKRRKIRTMLTGITLVLLTFTVLSFTSIKSFMKFNQIMRPNKPLYHGVLLRDRSWSPLQEVAYKYVLDDFQGHGIIAQRYWFINEEIENKTAVEIKNGNKSCYASGLLGLVPEEKDITGLDKFLIAGSWLEPGETDVIILPDKIAKDLGISIAEVGKAKVEIFGQSLLVKGIFDSEKMTDVRDLDDEFLTPVNFASLPSKELSKIKMEQKAQVFGSVEKLESFIHIEPSNIPIVPPKIIKDLKGTLQSIAVKFYPGENAQEIVESFISKLAAILFVGHQNKVTVYSSIGLTSLSGLSNLVIPILIAAMIVLNTMLGSVYERLREIGTYSAVGLAPVHIASLYLAESGVFAVMGAVGGYLLGQMVTKFLIITGLLHGLILNYSSLSAVFATIIIIITVLLSTIYPAKKASQMAVPDVTRRWVLPEPKGDIWSFEFPFTVSEIEVVGLSTFLFEYFNSYQDVSLGNFYTSDTRFDVEKYSSGKHSYIINTSVALAPFDLGVTQKVKITMSPMGQYNFYTINLEITRESGESSDWKRLNRRFLDGIRKQFLVWRTVSIEIKKDYEKQGKTMLGLSIS
ncbi:MAG: FtsX-like permease family protein [Candidatus Ratteibacteria bacterium]